MHCVLNYGCVKRNHHIKQLTSQQRRVVLCMQCNLYKIALQVDLVISMQLLSVSVSFECRTYLLHFGMAHLFRIKADRFKLRVPFGTSKMCHLIAKICSFICKSTDCITYTVNILSKNLYVERDFWFQQKANVDCKIL